MALGYDGKLYILAFDHRGSFQKKMFGIEGDPTPEQTEHDRGREAPDLRGPAEGDRAGRGPARHRLPRGRAVRRAQAASPRRPRSAACCSPCRSRSPGQNEFDFEYGDDFGAHIEKFDPDFSKVLVRYNPEGDAEMNQRQAERLKRLADWLHEHDRKFLFELLVPGRAGTSSSRSAATRSATTPSCARS